MLHILAIFIVGTVFYLAPSAQAGEQFQTIVEDATKRIAEEKPFYQGLVEGAKAKQKHYAMEAQTSQSKIMGQVFTNYKNIENSNTKQDNLIIFVSLSMPRELLLDYQSQIKHYGGRMIIRGLVDGSFKKTIAKLKLSDNNSLVVDINPKLFEQYQVKQVPTIVIQDSASFDKFTGSVSLEYALNQASELGDVNMVAAKYLARGMK